jgi:phosphatidylglycerol:prolipoprotein diacylglycerol transferase
MHPFIKLGSLVIPSMGVSILCGTILAFVLLFLLRKRTLIKPEHTLDGLIWAILLGFLGMKILYWVVTPMEFPKTWADLWAVISTGMVFYGGLIGGILGVFFCAKRNKESFFEFADYFAPAFCLAHAGGRVGCLLAGCCYGMEWHGALAIHLEGADRLPVQPMEAIFLVLLSGFLTLLFIKRKHRGVVAGAYLTLYSIWRFIIEFFRGDSVRGFLGSLSTSQWISIATFIAGVLLLIWSRRWKLDRLETKIISTEDETEAVSYKTDEEKTAETIAEETNADHST